MSFNRWALGVLTGGRGRCVPSPARSTERLPRAPWSLTLSISFLSRYRASPSPSPEAPCSPCPGCLVPPCRQPLVLNPPCGQRKTSHLAAERHALWGPRCCPGEAGVSKQPVPGRAGAFFVLNACSAHSRGWCAWPAQPVGKGLGLLTKVAHKAGWGWW